MNQYQFWFDVDFIGESVTRLPLIRRVLIRYQVKRREGCLNMFAMIGTVNVSFYFGILDATLIRGLPYDYLVVLI